MARYLAGVLVVAMPMPVFAQVHPILDAVPVSSGWVLPRNTQVVLALNEALSTRSKRQKQGDIFTLTVAQNVIFRGYIVIPRGSKAEGHIAWQTRKGAFGKSGKMELAFDYIEVGNTRIAISGHHREEGEGNSDATVATFVFFSMLGSGLITGHSAEVPAGKQFIVWTTEESSINLPPDQALHDGQSGFVAGDGLVAVPVVVRKPAAPPAQPKPFGNGKVKCVTCRN